MPSQQILSWLAEGAGWQFLAALLLLVMTKIFRVAFGKPFKSKHEVLFWGCGSIVLTLILIMLKNGLLSPLEKARQSEWAQQDQNIKDEIRIEREATHPNFVCNIGIVGVGQVEPQHQAGVTVLATIINRGNNSVARSWFLQAKLLSGETVMAPASLDIATNVLPSAAGMKLDSENDLPRLYLHNPMAGGAAMDGWALFLFDERYYNELNRAGVVFTMSFIDSYQVPTFAVSTNFAVFGSAVMKFTP